MNSACPYALTADNVRIDAAQESDPLNAEAERSKTRRHPEAKKPGTQDAYPLGAKAK